jgi:hypothetical protein
MNVKHGLVILGCTCALIAGCGGGNDTSDQPDQPNQPTAEGFWHGTISTGYTVDLAILENGETWGLYTRNNLFYGALYGNTVYQGNGKFTGVGLDFNGKSVTGSTYTGDFVAKKSLTAKVEKSITINAEYNDDYDLPPPSLASMAGSYYGQAATGMAGIQAIGVTVSASGDITLPSTNGCGGSGTIKAHSSNKNVYSVSMTFDGSYCPLGNGTKVTGIATYDSTLGIVRVLALNNNKSDGFVYVAARYAK